MQDTDVKNLVSLNLAFVRKKLGKTQQEFADAIGATRPNIGSYEEGRATPPLHTIIAISNLTGYSIDALLTIDIKDEESNN